jgi:hypothetical protein
VTETKQLSPLQWQLIMKCWKLNLRPGQKAWWAPLAWKLGSLGLWAKRLRKTNGPNFTWALFMFASALPEWLLNWMGKIYVGKPLKVKTRRELIATVKPHYLQYFRADNGDLPEGYRPPTPGTAPPRLEILPSPVAGD